MFVDWNLPALMAERACGSCHLEPAIPNPSNFLHCEGINRLMLYGSVRCREILHEFTGQVEVDIEAHLFTSALLNLNYQARRRTFQRFP